jgi:hypothetical protein
MKQIFLLPLFAALGLVVSACQKQQTEAERNAEIERQVQQHLDAEHQAEEQQKLAQRHAELDARERALAAKENQPVATPIPVATEPSSNRPVASNDTESGSYSTFYRKLEPYGDWMETGDYGYVFQPRQATQSRDWRPYTNGHWVYTDAGWTWISDEQFGWAAYHYGRWVRLRSVGWVWVPGEQWAPAWVSWRKGDDYVGWAPLPPEARFDRQTGIRNWADNYYDIGPEQYAFVPANEFGRKLSPREIVPTDRNSTIINQTINVTNITYSNSVIVDRGPSYDDLRSRSRQPIERYRLERTNDFNSEAPVFRGEVVALPTADFRLTERTARPNRVVRTIAQPVVERGWTGIQNVQAAQKARAKMQSEATPPADLPPNPFVRPEQHTAVPPRPAPAKVGQAEPPAVSTTTAIPLGTPAPLPITPSQSPPAATASTATTRPGITPAILPRRSRPGGRPQPSATATASAELAHPGPEENIFSRKEADRNRRDATRVAQDEEQKQRQQGQARHQAERQQKMEERRGQKPARPEASPTGTPEQPATASETPTTSSTASPTPIASDKKNATAQRRAKRAEKRVRKGQANPEASPEPDANEP